MAYYTTRFACVLPLRSAAIVKAARELHLQYARELLRENEWITFTAQTDWDGDDAALVLSSSSGDPDQVIAFVARCGLALGLIGHWGFTWAETCSEDLTDGFSGGAAILNLATGDVVASLDCGSWLTDTLGKLTPRSAAVPTQPPP